MSEKEDMYDTEDMKNKLVLLSCSAHWLKVKSALSRFFGKAKIPPDSPFQRYHLHT